MGVRTPSYQAGFYAPERGGWAAYPQAWRGCVGAWNPGLGPSGLVLRDWSGRKNNGTLTNGPVWSTSTGRQATSFDGVNDFVAVTDALQWHKGDFSFCCHANFRGNGAVNYNTVFSRDNGGSIWVFFSRDFQSLSGKMSVNFYDGSNNPGVQSGQVLALNTNYHLAFTVLGSTCSVYINGHLDGSGSIASWTRPTINDVQLGRWNIGGGRPMDGLLTDCLLYSRALRPSTINLLAQRPGIAYELAPRRYYSLPPSSARLRRILTGAT